VIFHSGIKVKTENIPCPSCDSLNGDIISRGYDFEYFTCKNEFEFKFCNSCEIAYLSPRPMIDQLRIIYPKTYNAVNFHKMKNPFIKYGRYYAQKAKIKSLKKYIKPGFKVLDIGCGSGSLLMIMKKFYGENITLYGNDIDESPLKFLQNNGIKTIEGRFEDIDISDNYFDIIILNQVIEHLDSVKDIVNKAQKLLSKDGILFIETPCMKGLDYLLFKEKYWGGWHFPRHWTIFNDNSLSNLIELNNFKTIEKKFLASPSFWTQSFHHYFLDKSYKNIAKFFTIKNPFNLIVFTFIDLILSKFSFTSNMRLVFKKL